MNPILTDLFRHNLWANLNLIDLCRSLPAETLESIVPGTYGGIRATLMHLIGAEERYLAALTGGPERRNPTVEETNPDLATLREHSRQSGEGFIAYAESVAGDPLLRVTWRGEVHEMPASTLLVQAINHATEHRSQVMTALTQSGIAPPDFDGWRWDEERRGLSE